MEGYLTIYLLVKVNKEYSTEGSTLKVRSMGPGGL